MSSVVFALVWFNCQNYWTNTNIFLNEAPYVIWIASIFPTVFFCCFRYYWGYYISSSPNTLLSSTGPWQFFRLLLVFTVFTFLMSIFHVFCRMSLKYCLSNAFCKFALDYMFFWGRLQNWRAIFNTSCHEFILLTWHHCCKLNYVDKVVFRYLHYVIPFIRCVPLVLFLFVPFRSY